MRARKRLAALLVAGALSAPMLVPAPATAQVGGLLGLEDVLNSLLGGSGGLLGTTGGTGALQGVLGAGALNDLLQGSSLLNQCGLTLALLDPVTCLTGSTTPTTTALNPFGTLSPFGSLSPTIPQLGGFGGFPQLGSFPIATSNQPIVITNNNSSTSSSSAAATAAPGGGASATATGNSGSNQSQTIVIP